MEYNFHGVTREWVKQAFTTLVDHLKDYQSDLIQWQAAATKQMVDNADRCTALEGSVSAQDKKITDLTNTVSTLTDSVSALTNTVNNLIATITADEAKQIVDDSWTS